MVGSQRHPDVIPNSNKDGHPTTSKRCRSFGRGAKCTTSYSLHCVVMVTVWILLPFTASQDIFAPPTITRPLRPEILYRKPGTNFTEPCRADGIPRPSYLWRKDGKNIDSDEFTTFDARSGDLRFKSFSKREEGVFTCVASNLMDNTIAASVSSPQTLKAIQLDDFHPKDAPINVRVAQYGYAMLECGDRGTVVGPPGDINYKWYMNNRNTDVPKDDGRLYFALDGSLHFTYTKKSDQLQNSQTYRCGITIYKGSKIVLGNHYELAVDMAIPRGLAPLMRHDNSGVQTSLGSQGNLECFFSGFEVQDTQKLPDIKWFDRAGKEITGGNSKYELKDHDRVLIIKDTKESDDAYYECQGQNSVGKSKRNAVYFNVTSAPIWVNPLVSSTVTVGSDVTLHCKARSLLDEVPPSQPMWSINGESYSKVGKANIEFSNDKTVMTVKNVGKPNDIMCVQCVVENSVGQTMGEACINVILPLTLKIYCAKCDKKDPGTCSCTEWDISKGDTVSVRFTESTDPAYVDKLEYEWTVHKNTYRLPDLPPHMTFDPVEKKYTLSTEGLTQKEFEDVLGKYEFKTYHPNDRRNITVFVGTGPNPSSDVSSAGFDMWIIGLVIGLIFLVIVIVIIVTIIVCRKLHEGDYNVDKRETNAGLDPVRELKEKAFPDLSRPEYEEEKKKPEMDLEYDDPPFGDDESLGEYAMEDVSRFNEDGSFIGDYSVVNKSAAPVPLHNQSHETVI